jgi:hypothetical protein
LLSQTRYPPDSGLLSPHYYIIPISIGFKEFKEAISMIASFPLCQEHFRLLTQTRLLILILHLPSEEEIYPINVGHKFMNIIGDDHLKTTGCPI